jgi:TPR repeat protein
MCLLAMAAGMSGSPSEAADGKPKILLSPEQKKAVRAEALQEVSKKAAAGDKDYQMVLGNMYYEGIHVKKDYLLAVEWFLKAASQGKIEAQFALGVMYYKGQGVGRDIEKAVQWMKKAGSQDHVRAQYMLGLIYYRGEEEGEPDYEQARAWFTKSAKNGNPDAMTSLGNMWEYGKGVEKSKSAAADWYYQAGITWLNDFDSRDDALASLDMVGRVDSANPLWLKLREAIYSVAPTPK